ncbi:type II secretion system protein [Roseateles sp. P5_E11]
MRGFTLLETLVTLVIVAMVAGLISEGLFQLTRIERSLQGANAGVRLAALHREWLVQTLRGMVGAGSPVEAQFAGSATQIKGMSTLAPVNYSSGPTPVVLTLESKESDTELWLTQREIGLPEQRVQLAAWPFKGLHWVYEDDGGVSYQDWPPESTLIEQALPRLIRLEQGQGGRVLLVASPQNGYLRWLRRDWNSL